MIFLLIILFAVAIYGVRFSNFHTDYISKNSSNAIKGIFAVIILLAHSNSYITLDHSFINRGFTLVLSYLGQLIVAMYLFYSGYGIMESIIKKDGYMKSFPKNRILKTLVHFDMAVILFAIVMTLIGKTYPLKNYLLCWIGWESIGNSNWFIFDILCCYAIVYLSYMVLGLLKIRNKYSIATLSTVLVGTLWIALRVSKTGSFWWYDTVMSFPLGIWFSIFKQEYETVMKTKWSYAILVLAISAFIGWRHFMGIDSKGICACLFCITLVTVSTKVKLDNKVLQWLGANAFSIYIIQRIPMNIYEHFGVNSNPYLFIALTIPSALLLAYLFNLVLNRIDRSFFAAK